jgi:uncharacterized protein YndB with AHSA1/START domain
MADADPGIGTGYDLDITPARAFALISDPAELRHWFAEEVEIEPRIGGRFAFAGRGTYAPVSTVLTRFDPGVTLAYDWPLHGVTGTVTLTVTAKDTPEVCRVDVACDFPELPPIPRGRELIDDLWRFYMGNLKTHADGASGVILPDFGDPAPEVRQSIHIDAPRAKVFAALIDPALLAGWSGGTPVVEPRVGGRYTYGWSYEIAGKQVAGGPTRIIELVENERLVTDWPDWRGDETNNTQKITWLLEDDGEGTRLTLIHDGFVRAADISDYPFGWAWFAGEIRRVAEAA